MLTSDRALSTDILLKFDKKLDTSGLACPLPLLKMKQALAGMAVGEVIYVITTDRGALRDFRAFVEQSAHLLLSLDESPKCIGFWVQKR